MGGLNLDKSLSEMLGEVNKDFLGGYRLDILLLRITF
jgi:hypothetical protein